MFEIIKRNNKPSLNRKYGNSLGLCEAIAAS